MISNWGLQVWSSQFHNQSLAMLNSLHLVKRLFFAKLSGHMTNSLKNPPVPVFYLKVRAVRNVLEKVEYALYFYINQYKKNTLNEMFFRIIV